MQAIIPRCRNLIFIRNLLAFSSAQQQVFSFHSSPVCYDKPKNKSKSNFKGRQEPSKDSKDHARYMIRQKRADTKKAVQNLIFPDPKNPIKKAKLWKIVNTKSDDTESIKKRRAKSVAARAEKIHNQRMRRMCKNRKKSRGEDDDYEGAFFEGYDSWNGFSRRSFPRFDWRKTFYRADAGKEEWGTFNESVHEGNACNEGSPKDRAMLGLSPNGPLKMKDVKTAFHLSALKWHPDKHQGPTQAVAEEKFKLCVDAYKSLCSALSGA